jgi:adenine phosphoribosyltransferase
MLYSGDADGGLDPRALIRDIENFPKPGIVFKDLTPLIADPDGLKWAVSELTKIAAPLEVDVVLGAEARGFLLGPALALALGAGFVMARKPGKLPYQTIAADYQLEYGSASLECHSDAMGKDTRVLIHDDLLATGGTALALGDLAQRFGAQLVGFSFLIELAFLGGRSRLAPHDTHALLSFDS